MAMTLACLWPHAGVTFHLKKHFRLLPQVRDSSLKYDCHHKLWSMQWARRLRAQQSRNCTWLLTLYWEESVTACWGMMDHSKLWSAEWSGGLELKAKDLLVWHHKNDDERSLPEKQLSARLVPRPDSHSRPVFVYVNMLQCEMFGLYFISDIFNLPQKCKHSEGVLQTSRLERLSDGEFSGKFSLSPV